MQNILSFIILVSFYTTGLTQETRGQEVGGKPVGVSHIEDPIKMKGFYFGIDSTADSRIPYLAYADSDAIKISQFFNENELYINYTSTLLINSHAGKEAIIHTLEEFLLSEEVNNTDRVILYFASHGYKTEDGVYLMVHKASLNYPWKTLIEIDELSKYISKLTKKGIEVILMIDACYAGDFLFGSFSSSKNERDKLIKFLSSGSKSVEGESWDGGIFTYYLIEGMKGDASDEKDDKINIRELGRFVVDSVESDLNGTQSPKYYAWDEKVNISKISNFEEEIVSNETLDIEYNDEPSIGISINYQTNEHSLLPTNSLITTKEKKQNKRKKKQSRLNTNKNKSIAFDTLKLINRIETFRNKLIDDPFTFPDSIELLKIEKDINQLLKSDLKQFSIYLKLQSDSLIIQGLKLMNNDEGFFKSRPFFDKAIRKNPDNVSIWMLKAQTYIFLNYNQKALNILDAAIPYFPNYPNFYLGKAWAYSNQNKLHQTQENLNIFYEKINKIKKIFFPDEQEDIDWLFSGQKNIIEKVDASLLLKKNSTQYATIVDASLLLYSTQYATIDAQNSFDDEVNKIARMLVDQLNNQKKVSCIAVADFTYEGQKNTKIGKYIADQLNDAIMMNDARFSMVNRENVRYAMRVLEQKDSIHLEKTKYFLSTITANAYDPMVENNFSEDLKADVIKADVIIHGEIMEQGDNLKVTIEASRNKKNNDNVAFARGNLIIIPDVANLLQKNVAPSSTPSIASLMATNESSGVIPFKHNNLTFEVVSCQQNGRNIECTLNVVSSDIDADLWLYFDNTIIVDAIGNEFHVEEIKLADVSSVNHRVGKSLISDIPIECVLKFTEVNKQISSIAKMQINCHEFKARLNNIPVY